MLQKVIQVGNSAAITIPKDFLREVPLKIGDEVLVETDVESAIISIRPKKLKRKMIVTPEFVRWTEKFIEKYRPVLEELAKK